MKQINVPRSTYHAARRRAYAERWLKDRYVPDPARFGYPRLTFCLARPFADRTSTLATKWDQEKGNVLTWSTSQFAFGVFFHDSEEASMRWAERATKDLSSWALTVRTDTRQPSVPVYFDFEGAWANLTELGGALTYPQGVGGSPASPAEGGMRSLRESWAAGELLRRPFDAEAAGRPGHLIGPWGLPWSQQSLLRKGWVRHRVILDPHNLPPYRGRRPGLFVFITGHLRTGVRPEALFTSLTRACHVYPFLFAVQDEVALVGAVGGSRETEAAAPPGRSERRPVMATLSELIEGIEVLQDSIDQVVVTTDHRYDRLVPEGRSG